MGFMSILRSNVLNKFIAYFSAVSLLMLSAPVFAKREEILNFTSNIIINRDASIDVTETIFLHTNQDRILHGIVRRLPTHYIDSNGTKRKTTYQLKKILLNNLSSPYHIEFSNNQFAIYIGQLDVTLAPGNYTYTIQYHVENAVNFLKNTDELYWNITGHEWDFPIRNIEATIELPAATKILQFAGYAGKPGEKEQSFIAKEAAPNKVTFVTTKPFNPGAGLTITVSWPKGIVIRPVSPEKETIGIANKRVVLQITGLLLISLLLAWYYQNRSQKKNASKDRNNLREQKR